MLDTISEYSAKVIGKCVQYESWDRLKVGVYRGEEKIGEYERNYNCFYNTFFPFEMNGKHLALYSPDYTATRIMELPSCKDIGGEKPNTYGFCPVEFFVPYYSRSKCPWNSKKVITEGEDPKFTYAINDEVPRYWKADGKDQWKPVKYFPFGLVAGCVWSDDSLWKIQYLDLPQADKGILKREDRFDYIELPRQLSLQEAVDMSSFHNEDNLDEELNLDKNPLTLSLPVRFQITTGRKFSDIEREEYDEWKKQVAISETS